MTKKKMPLCEADANDLLNRMIKEKDDEERKEAESAPDLKADEILNERKWFKKWTANGAKLVNCAGGNFWMAGSNRKRCSILRPARLKQLVRAGILEKSANSYRFIP